MVPGAPVGQSLQVSAQPIASLPGMPPIPPMPSPGAPGGVSIQISNVMGAPPAQYAPHPYVHYGPQGYPLAPYPGAPFAPDPRLQQQQAPSVVSMMKQDASQRAMDAVARRGPARLLGYGVGATMLVMMFGLMLLPSAGVPLLVVLLAELPCAIIAFFAFMMGRRAGEGVGSHHLEQAILKVASEHEGLVRVVALAQATGRPLRECQIAIDAMVTSGHATVDADEHGVLIYRVPDLEPKRKEVVYDAQVISGSGRS